jgi:hypothetical protein
VGSQWQKQETKMDRENFTLLLHTHTESDISGWGFVNQYLTVLRCNENVCIQLLPSNNRGIQQTHASDNSIVA